MAIKNGDRVKLAPSYLEGRPNHLRLKRGNVEKLPIPGFHFAVVSWEESVWGGPSVKYILLSDLVPA